MKQNKIIYSVADHHTDLYLLCTETTFPLGKNYFAIDFELCHKVSNKSIQVINFILFQAKYFISLSKTIPTLGHFERYLSYRIQIEKEIALIHDKLDLFENNWKLF